MSEMIVILNFHGVGAPAHEVGVEKADVWIEKQPFLEILDAVKGADGVELTFDDGNLSDIEIALPALFERALRATFFVIADRIDTQDYLTKSDVRALAQAGMKIGSHGMKHVAWRGLGAGRLREETVDAKNRIEQALGDEIIDAACPFGSYDRRSLRALREAGFSRVCTSDTGPTTRDAWLASRNTLHAGDTAETTRPIIEARGGDPVRAIKKLIKRWR